MNLKILSIFLLSATFCLLSCKEETRKSGIDMMDQKDNFQLEKAAILEVLNDETKAAFNRDYEAWKENGSTNPM